MKPRTANEKLVTKLSKSLPSLSKAQEEWGKTHIFDQEGYMNKQGEVFCSLCGGVFHATTDGEMVCPHCGRTIQVRKSRRINVYERKYMSVITTCKGWQVTRNFHVTRDGKKGVWKKMYWTFHEVSQVWMNTSGEHVLMGVGMMWTGYYKECAWQYNELSVKCSDNYIFSGNVYPRTKVLPILKRNGYKLVNDMCQPTIMHRLLTDNRFETLFKAGQYGFAKYMYYQNDKLVNDWWETIRICMRNKYIVTDASMYFDYLLLLDRFGYDTHNAHYVCPADLKEAHDRLLNRKRREEARERQERDRREMERRKKQLAASQRRYTQKYEKYLGLMIIGNGLTIRPLQNVKEFIAEGEHMHHCVFSCEYYKKYTSLILTARDAEGNRLETIEIDLKSFKIIQSRGVCNQDSPKHKEIVKLMNAHMGDVKRLARPKTKKTAKTTQIAAAA